MPGIVLPEAPGVAPQGLPPVPRGLPKIQPEANSQPMLPLDPPGFAIDAPRPAFAPPVPMQYRGDAILRRGSFNPYLPGQTLEPAEQKVLSALQDLPHIDQVDPTTRALIQRPSPRLAAAISADPDTAARHNIANTYFQQQTGVTRDPNLTNVLEPSHPLQAPTQATLPGGGITQLPAPPEQAGLFPTNYSGVTGWLRHLATQYGQMLTGIGPGLAHLVGNEAQIDYNTMFHNSLAEREQQRQNSDVGKVLSGLEHSYGKTINDPLGQLKSDPLGFVSNVATPFFAGAGGVARASELGRAGELADAAGISKGAQIAKTLFRPQPQERSISFGGAKTPNLADLSVADLRQVANSVGAKHVGFTRDEITQNIKATGQYKEGAKIPGTGEMTLHPPAYKSALGGYLQTKVLDPLLEKHIAEPTPVSRVTARVAKILHAGAPGKITSAAQFGRKARTGMENDIRIRGGALAARMDPQAADVLARGTAFHDRWQALHNAGVGIDEAARQPGREWTPIATPPHIPMRGNGGPEFLTPADLKSNPHLQLSESQLADKFERGNGMIPAHSVEEKNPEQFRYVPSDLINGMKPYKRGEGHLETAANVIDRGTQLIRQGRFLTPAYAEWAAQNGLIGLSQQGLMMFRNALNLKRDFPNLPTDVQKMIDGGVGIGVTMATRGERAYGKRMAAIQHAWHGFNDQWARRMSAIHELHAAGYHTPQAWTKLARTNPTEFRKVVGGQGNREAINYTEMTPSERALFGRLFTAYGWTRGASTYAARFPLMHPIQARVGEQVGEQGSNLVDKYYAKLGGMAPSWLREFLPLGGGKLLGTSWASPTGTLGNLISEVPGGTIGQTASLEGEAAPVPAAIAEMLTGTNRFGTAYKGTGRLTGPISELAGRFKPWAALKTMSGGQSVGTMKKGTLPGIEKLLGDPEEQLRDPTNTAALGLKDYEQSLSKPDLINFRQQRDESLLPSQIAAYTKAAGYPPPAGLIAHVRADYKAMAQRDLYEYHYAQAHGAKAWKSLPAANKLNGVISFLQQHNLINPQQSAQFTSAAKNLTSETELEHYVSELWKVGGIGASANAWKTVLKHLQPKPLKAANG